MGDEGVKDVGNKVDGTKAEEVTGDSGSCFTGDAGVDEVEDEAPLGECGAVATEFAMSAWTC